MFKFVFLWTDVAIWTLVGCALAYGWTVVRSPNLAASWRRVFRDAPALCSALILAVCLAVTLADSVHFRARLKPVAGAAADMVAYDAQTRSLLDVGLAELVESR